MVRIWCSYNDEIKTVTEGMPCLWKLHMPMRKKALMVGVICYGDSVSGNPNTYSLEKC